jgi:hypothetical protein
LSKPFRPAFREFLIRLLGRVETAGLDLGFCVIDMGRPFGGEKVVEVFGVIVHIVAQHFSDVFIDGRKASVRRTGLDLFVELVIELDLVHKQSS